MNLADSKWAGARVRCVVMCGGRSTRFGSPAGHKSGAQVDEHPLIYHVIEYWRAFTNDFIFVVKHGKETLIPFIQSLPINAEFVEPARIGGIADGLSYAEPLISDRFIVVLGDCFCQGEFTTDMDFDYGVGIIASEPKQIQQNYSVSLGANNQITAVEEKPGVVTGKFCGTGFYFFQADIFDYIRATPLSRRTGELEITDVLHTLIASGRQLQGVVLEGLYINVTVPDDMLTVRAALSKD